jgi:hypothetical protein
MLLENIKEIARKVGEARVITEHYFKVKSNEKGIHSFSFGKIEQTKVNISVILLTLVGDTWKHERHSGTIEKNEHNTLICKFNSLYGENKKVIVRELLGLLDELNNQLNEYTFWNGAKENIKSRVAETLYDGATFGAMLWRSNDLSSRENEIKNVSTRRNSGADSSLEIVSDILKSINLPNKEHVHSINLNGDFRISYF